MFKLHTLGLVLAALVTALAISGAVTLIALDFVGIDGLARAWSGLSGRVSGTPVQLGPARLTGIG